MQIKFYARNIAATYSATLKTIEDSFEILTSAKLRCIPPRFDGSKLSTTVTFSPKAVCYPHCLTKETTRHCRTAVSSNISRRCDMCNGLNVYIHMVRKRTIYSTKESGIWKRHAARVTAKGKQTQSWSESKSTWAARWQADKRRTSRLARMALFLERGCTSVRVRIKERSLRSLLGLREEIIGMP